jgi:cytochrome c-type biogenesis protein CcmH/NrfG
LRILGGRWREADHFRCLGGPVERAMVEAGTSGVGTWQQTATAQLTLAARRASDALETDRAIELLGDALAIDGCNTGAWRLLGRLQFESGRAARAVPPLAVGLALAPRDAAAMVDLADALAALNAGPSAGSESLDEAVAALDTHGTTRAIVEKARARSGSSAVPPPRVLAAVLYEEFLARTDADDPRVEAVRRHAESELTRLESKPRPAPAKVKASPVAKTAKAKPKPKSRSAP